MKKKSPRRESSASNYIPLSFDKAVEGLLGVKTTPKKAAKKKLANKSIGRTKKKTI
jgi:hypothetical protein